MRSACGAVGEGDGLGAIAERGAVRDAQRAAAHIHAAVEGVRAAKDDGARIDQTINLHAAGAGDGIRHGERAGAVKAQRAVVDHIAGSEAAASTIVADLQRAGVDRGVASVAVRASENEFAARAVANHAARAADIAIEDEGAAVGAIEGRVRAEHDGRVDVVGENVRTRAGGAGEVHAGQRGAVVEELEGAAADRGGRRAGAVRACEREIVHLEDARDVIRGRGGDSRERLARVELHGSAACACGRGSALPVRAGGPVSARGARPHVVHGCGGE